MDLLETLKIILDNEKLMDDYGYTKQDVKKLKLNQIHQNEFISFMQQAVQLMTNDTDTERIIVNRLIKLFEEKITTS